MKPTAEFIETAMKNGSIEDFFVMIHCPNPEKVVYKRLAETDVKLPIVRRKRRDNNGGRFVGTEKRSRRPLEAVSGRKPETKDPLADSLREDTRGSMLFEIVGEEPFWQNKADQADQADRTQLAVLFGYVFPLDSAPNKGRVGFRAKVAQLD